MRARLGSLAAGQRFSLICAEEMAGKMDRVIAFANGVTRDKIQTRDGVVVTVEKGPISGVDSL